MNRVEELEAFIVEMWNEGIFPYLHDPRFEKVFIKLDRKVRELGLTDKLRKG